MDVNAYHLELMSILLNVFQPQKLMNKTMKAEKSFLRRKDKKHQKKKLSCKFIRINTSNEERGYDTDYEFSKMHAFISKFKNKKIKGKENKIKELKDEIKNLKLQLTNQSV